MKANMVSWFEIPVVDMDRAKTFYEKVFDIKIRIEQFGDTIMGWFPGLENTDAPGASGALVYNKDFYKPSANGTLVYFSSPEITYELSKVEEAGGVTLNEKTLISDDIGYMAVILDTEGNRIALYSKE